MVISEKNLKKFGRRALKLAKNRDFSHRAQHISFLVKKNKIISIGFNSCKTHRLALDHNYKWPSTHSEIAAISRIPRQTPQNAPRIALINFRISRATGRFTAASPCPDCFKMIKSAGIGRVYFTTNSGDFDHLILGV